MPFMPNRMIGHTIEKLEVSGYGITLVTDNGLRFEYEASDGGYSTWYTYEEETNNVNNKG